MRPGARLYIYIKQVRFHRYPGGVFVGHWPPGAPVAPCSNKKFYIYSDVTHTHTPCRSRVGEMDMKMKWPWTWDDTLPNRDTRRGTQKKTPTPHTLPKTGEPWKGKGKEKADAGRAKNRPEEGGRTEAHDATYKARAKPTSAREGPQPDLAREHTWDRGPMED